MQSEFAAHLGMKAKCFCRICWAKGYDVKDLGDNPDAHEHTHGSDSASGPAFPASTSRPASPVMPSQHEGLPAHDSDASDAESGNGVTEQASRKGRAETGLPMLERV